jgi:hypothetical protein
MHPNTIGPQLGSCTVPRIVGLRMFFRDGWARKWEKHDWGGIISQNDYDKYWRRYSIASRRYWDSIKELYAIKATTVDHQTSMSGESNLST